jgi:cation transport ATPase
MTELIERDWQRRSDRRRQIVLLLELFATSCWLLYGILGFDALESWMWILYYVFLIVLFLPGLLYVIHDIIRTRKMSAFDRAPSKDAEKENPEFTKTITNASSFLVCFMTLCILPSFYFLTMIDAFRWTTFFVGLFVLVIATLAGACWKVNTSWPKEQ